MLIFYRILTIIFLVLSPIILIVRLFKKKEDPKRFKEKFCFFSKTKIKGKLIWFHGVCVSGKMIVTHDDGSSIEVGPGDAYAFAPGHDGEVISDEPFVGYEFNSATAATYAKE